MIYLNFKYQLNSITGQKPSLKFKIKEFYYTYLVLTYTQKIKKCIVVKLIDSSLSLESKIFIVFETCIKMVTN